MEMNDDGSRHTRSLSAFAGRALVLRYSKGVKDLIIMMPNYFIRSTNWMEMKCKREQKKLKNENFDSGPIIHSQYVRVYADETVESLFWFLVFAVWRSGEGR